MEKTKSSRTFTAGLISGGFGVAIVIVAAFLAGRATSPPTKLTAGDASMAPAESTSQSDWLKQRYLSATASHGADTMAISTGPIDDSEGLFVLDFLTGELTCFVLNSRSGKFDAGFKANVIQALGVEPGKKPKYLMVTGVANFPRGIGGRLGQCAVYVVDSNTGNFGVWGVPYNRNAAATGTLQMAPLYFINAGKARNVALE